MMTQGVDSHCHVFDTTLFPYSPDAAYKPPPCEAGTAAQFAAVLDAHRISHALLVNPTSGYGYDNRCMLAAIGASKGRFKGIARVRPGADERALAELSDAGVIGLRLDLVTDGAASLGEATTMRLLAQAREIGWLVQVQCERDQLHDAEMPLRAAGVPLIFDHCGRPDAERGIDQPGFQSLLRLGREGHTVKLSGPFRFYNAFSPSARIEPFVEALIETFTPQRCVWGSDWPFLRLPIRMDYGPVLANLERWFPDERDRRQVLWETPAQLFGFT
ncbi:MAG TPA: amidohydrolase family protein [Casimicrobiaceae bacterium]|nr:amidohydrolase family protein [Casimicrobiaceae bacterium]